MLKNWLDRKPLPPSVPESPPIEHDNVRYADILTMPRQRSEPPRTLMLERALSA